MEFSDISPCFGTNIEKSQLHLLLTILSGWAAEASKKFLACPLKWRGEGGKRTTLCPESDRFTGWHWDIDVKTGISPKELKGQHICSDIYIVISSIDGKYTAYTAQCFHRFKTVLTAPELQFQGSYTAVNRKKCYIICFLADIFLLLQAGLRRLWVNEISQRGESVTGCMMQWCHIFSDKLHGAMKTHLL